jgi:hypothetical protein
MSYNLLIDDERTIVQLIEDLHCTHPIYFEGNWKIARTYLEFINTIETTGLPKAISFDNDLGEEMEGYDCLKWLSMYCMNNEFILPLCLVHSQNTVATENMNVFIKNHLKHAQ